MAAGRQAAGAAVRTMAARMCRVRARAAEVPAVLMQMRPQRRRGAETDAEEFKELQKMKSEAFFLCVCLCVSVSLRSNSSFADEKRFTGKHFSGTGDVAYIEMLETSRRMFE